MRQIQKKAKNRQHSDDTQISRPDFVSPAGKTANQNEKGPEPQPKNPHQKTQDCLRHERGKPNVSSKYAQNELASLWLEKG